MKFTKVLVFMLVLNLLCLGIEGKKNKGKKCRKNKNAPGCAKKKTRGRIQEDEFDVNSPTTTSHLNSSKPLHCNCSYIKCTVRRRHLNCAGNIVMGVCGCCPTCAKQLGEKCGGEMSYKGVCDVNMTCRVEGSNNRRSTVNVQAFRPNNSTEEDTVCVATTAPVIPEIPATETCQPECSPEFCSQKKNKNAFCSARNTAMEVQGYQGSCQHTNCKACFYQARPPCKKCKSNDFDCIESFANCARKKTICKKDTTCKKKKPKKQKGEFKCWVPQCK